MPGLAQGAAGAPPRLCSVEQEESGFRPGHWAWGREAGAGPMWDVVLCAPRCSHLLCPVRYRGCLQLIAT